MTIKERKKPQAATSYSVERVSVRSEHPDVARDWRAWSREQLYECREQFGKQVVDREQGATHRDSRRVTWGQGAIHRSPGKE